MTTEIIKSRRRSFAIEIKPGKIVVRAPIYSSDEDVYDFISKNSKWINKHISAFDYKVNEFDNYHILSDLEIFELKSEAEKYIPDKVKYYANIMGIKYGKINIRKLKSKWGSCTAEGNLSFNLLLMLAPKEVTDSVIIHELCHRKYMNHSKLFYNEILKYFPDYYLCNKWLRDNGTVLMSMLEK